MKKLLLTLILGALLTLNVYSQPNSSFEYKSQTYYYEELPQTTSDKIDDSYTILETTEGYRIIVDDDGIIWIVMSE